MKRSITLLIFLGFLFTGLVGCDKLNLGPKKTEGRPQAAPIVVKGTVIAKVNNMPITLEDLNQEIEAYNSMVPADKPEAKITTRDQKLDYLKNEMVRRALLYQSAMDKGLDRKEDVVKALDKTKQELLVVELVREEAGKVEVSSKEIEDAYNAYKEQLKEPEERQIREIMVPTEQEARDIVIQYYQGADFATLAKERSKAASAKDAGDLGFIKPGKKLPPFDQEAFSKTLEVGRISNIFKGSDGYYIIKLEAKKGGKERSLSEMWDDVKRGLTFLKQQQRIDDLVGNLTNSPNTKLEFYEGEVK